MIKNRKNIILFFIKNILLIILFIVISKYIFGVYLVKNNNYKELNIAPHDILIYYKLNNNYQNNDIVFFKNGIYRVIGTYGQIINKKGNKYYIDNENIGEISYNYNYPHTISKNELFLISFQSDSRTVGCINKKDISGKLIFRMQIRDF